MVIIFFYSCNWLSGEVFVSFGVNAITFAPIVLYTSYDCGTIGVPVWKGSVVYFLMEKYQF